MRAVEGRRDSVAGEAPDASEIQRCRRCPLWRNATHGVPGVGPAHARLMLVGEQPGDQEDRVGQPFVGPAGGELDRLLLKAGLERPGCYVTNAVKHFKWEPRGKRRLHRRPNVVEIEACNLWLEREIAAVRPRVIVALGATGRPAAIAALRRSRLVHPSGARLLVTYHPSAALRADEGAAQVRAWLVEDLRRARQELTKPRH